MGPSETVNSETEASKDVEMSVGRCPQPSLASDRHDGSTPSTTRESTRLQEPPTSGKVENNAGLATPQTESTKPALREPGKPMEGTDPAAKLSLLLAKSKSVEDSLMRLRLQKESMKTAKPLSEAQRIIEEESSMAPKTSSAKKKVEIPLESSVGPCQDATESQQVDGMSKRDRSSTAVTVPTPQKQRKASHDESSDANDELVFLKKSPVQPARDSEETSKPSQMRVEDKSRDAPIETKSSSSKEPTKAAKSKTRN